MHSHVICICTCTRVAGAAEEVVYEVVAEPQEPQKQAPPQEVRGELAQGPTDPSAEQQTQGKPGACPIISNYDTYIYLYYLRIKLKIVWNPSCMIIRFP